jgi:hypothetical protein
VEQLKARDEVGSVEAFRRHVPMLTQWRCLPTSTQACPPSSRSLDAISSEAAAGA